ncbi:electron transport complex subunit RsxA [bacterium]|nr:electron transport complex subunit RsxA [bacterium]
MTITTLLLVLLSAVFVNNFVFAKFLGTCPYLGCSKDTSSATGMGLAVIFVMTMTSAVCWAVYHFFLYPSTANVLYLVFGSAQAAAADSAYIKTHFDLTFLSTLSFILVIAALVQFVEMVIQKVSPALYSALGIYLPLITTNCAVLAVAILNIDGMMLHGTQLGYGHSGSLLFALMNGFGGGVGFTVALLLMSGIRERLDLGDVPRPLRGMPIAFITAGLLAISFMGFLGLVK